MSFGRKRMNVENINKLIDRLESIDDSEYDQGVYISHCGSFMCVIGHADFLITKDHPDIHPNKSSTQDWLGISYDLCKQIYDYNPFYPDESVNITKRIAINMLKNLIETGEVVWRKENEC